MGKSISIPRSIPRRICQWYTARMPFERVVARRAEAASDEASHDTHPSAEQEQRLRAKIQRFFHESFTAFSEGEAKRLEWSRAHTYAYGEIHADHPEEIRDHLELIQEIVEAHPEDDGGQRLAIKVPQAAIVAQELLAWVTSYEVPPIEKANLIRYVRTWEHLVNFGASLRAGDVSSSVPMFARFNVIPGMASIFEHQQKELRDTILANKDEVSQLFRSCEREEMIRLAALFADIGQYATQHSYGWYARNQAEDRGKTEQFNQLIRTWAKSAESPPLIKYLCLAELKKDVPSYEASRNERMNLWRTIDGNGSEVGIDVRHIARGALAIVDVNDAILQVAEYEHANQPAENAPPSYYLRAILDWYEQKKIDALGTFDAYDIFEEYEKNIKPYLSAVERDRFEEVWGTADAEVHVTALLHEWLEKGPYQKVAFESPEVVMNDMGYRGHLSSDTVSLVMSQMHREAVREDIERDLGCDLASFSLREQAQLLSLMTYGDKKRYRELTHLTRRYGKSAGICCLPVSSDQRSPRRLLRWHKERIVLLHRKFLTCVRNTL